MAIVAPSARLHVVLVPGFAGFDALGQLEYGAGVTPPLALGLPRGPYPSGSPS